MKWSRFVSVTGVESKILVLLDLVTLYRTLALTAQDCFRKVTKFSFLHGLEGMFGEELKLRETVMSKPRKFRQRAPEDFRNGTL